MVHVGVIGVGLSGTPCVTVCEKESSWALYDTGRTSMRAGGPAG